ADPKNPRLSRLISNVPAVGTPDRVVVTRSIGESKKVVTLQIQNPKTGISRKQRHSQSLAVRRESRGPICFGDSTHGLPVPRGIERIDTCATFSARDIS